MSEKIKFRQDELNKEDAYFEAEKIANKRLEMMKNKLENELGDDIKELDENDIIELVEDSIDYEEAHDALVEEKIISKPQNIKIIERQYNITNKEYRLIRDNTEKINELVNGKFKYFGIKIINNAIILTGFEYDDNSPIKETEIDVSDVFDGMIKYLKRDDTINENLITTKRDQVSAQPNKIELLATSKEVPQIKKEKYFSNEKFPGIEIPDIPTPKVISYISTVQEGLATESDKGVIYDDSHEVKIHKAGLEINLTDNPIIRRRFFISNLDSNNIINKLEPKLKRIINHDDKLNSRYEEALIAKIKDALPRAETMKDAWIVDEYNRDLEIQNYSGVSYSKLDGLIKGGAIIKNNDYKDSKYNRYELKSALVISEQDAAKRNIPGQKYPEPLTVCFSDNQKKFNEIYGEYACIEDPNKKEAKVFEAEIEMIENKNENRNGLYTYKIKDVDLLADIFEVKINLDDDSFNKEIIKQEAGKFDQRTSIFQEKPFKNGKYLIKLTVPSSGEYRGQRVYSIYSGEEARQVQEKISHDPKKLLVNAIKEIPGGKGKILPGLRCPGYEKDDVKSTTIYAIPKDGGFAARVALCYTDGKIITDYGIKGFKSKLFDKTFDSIENLKKEFDKTDGVYKI